MTARLDKAKIWLTRQVLNILFLPKPKFHTGEQSVKAYEEIYLELEGDTTRIDVVLPRGIPAAEFFDFLYNKQEFLFHGSNQLDLDILTPKKQNNFRGEEVNGVFASSDSLWAIYILPREKFTPAGDGWFRFVD